MTKICFVSQPFKSWLLENRENKNNRKSVVPANAVRPFVKVFANAVRPFVRASRHF